MAAPRQNAWNDSGNRPDDGKLSRLYNRHPGAVRRRDAAIAPPPPYENLQNEAERSRNVLYNQRDFRKKGQKRSQLSALNGLKLA